MSQNATIRLRKAVDGQYYFRVEARNGRILATGETYGTVEHVKDGAEALCQALGADHRTFDIIDETQEA